MAKYGDPYFEYGQWAANATVPGEQLGVRKGLTSVVVLKVIHSHHQQFLLDLRLEPMTFGLQVQLCIQ